MKDRLPFFCTSCGAGRDGECIMQPHNVFSGKGCPCCQSIAGVRARFDAATHLERYQLSAVNDFSGMAYVNSVRYTVTSPDSLDSNPLLKSTLNCAIRQRRIPDAAELTAQRETKEIGGKFKAVFNKGGEIFFVAWNTDHLTTPGPFFKISTGIRILREPLTNSAISMSGVRG